MTIFVKLQIDAQTGAEASRQAIALLSQAQSKIEQHGLLDRLTLNNRDGAEVGAVYRGGVLDPLAAPLE